MKSIRRFAHTGSSFNYLKVKFKINNKNETYRHKHNTMPSPYMKLMKWSHIHIVIIMETTLHIVLQYQFCDGSNIFPNNKIISYVCATAHATDHHRSTVLCRSSTIQTSRFWFEDQTIEIHQTIINCIKTWCAVHTRILTLRIHTRTIIIDRS